MEKLGEIRGQIACEPIATFVGKLFDRGFTMLDNGDYKAEPFTRPNDDSLYFRLQSPVRLENLDLTDDTYFLATIGEYTYMCECHFHMVKLISVAQAGLDQTGRLSSL